MFFLKKKTLSFHSFKVLSKLFKQNDAFFKQAKKMPSFLVDWESAEQKVYEKQWKLSVSWVKRLQQMCSNNSSFWGLK